MIILKQISLEQNKQPIFKEFDLHIKAKERLVIWGASGSGKTTLLRLIAGLNQPDSGEIWIDGCLATKGKDIIIPPHKREVNMVFQDLALWSHLSVEGNIAFGLKIAKFSKPMILQRVKDILLLVGLEGYEKRAIDSLSGGEQQRIALARALVINPKILLMDEPLSGLDSGKNRELRREIVRLQKLLGFTLVYVTHNQIEAEDIATEILSI